MNLKSALFVLGAFAAGPALACTAPTPPASIPDGKTASKDTMLATKKEIDQYKRQVEEYLACEVNPMRVQMAQTELERVANRFNAEVRAFKAANGG
jgi:spore maturation protein CgeB